MTILTSDSLEFAREHISKFYDSDFFPRQFEFEALWFHWEEVKKELLGKNIAKTSITSPRVMTVPKPRGGYRVVHQLEPVEALIYTALAWSVAEKVEKARPPASARVACSYRIELKEGSFFANGSGWRDFVEQTEVLAKNNKFLLATDITDFYNQIYLHRLNNALEFADKNLKLTADDIESFIGTLNGKSSCGVPVGPAASIVMAEAVLMDVDQFIANCGLPHTRYVDDLRIFGSSAAVLERMLERLTLYLYENHRLTLASEKTTISNAAEFVEKFLHSEDADEKTKLFETIEVMDPYTGDVEEIEMEVVDDKDIEDAITVAFERVLADDILDMGLARSVIRLARRNELALLVGPLLDDLPFFLPVINDVVLYFHETLNLDAAPDLPKQLVAAVMSGHVTSDLARYWVEWLIAQHKPLLDILELKKFISSGGNVENQALAAITQNDLAWVREKKGNFYNLGARGRRAVLNSCRVLPSDERKHWLKLVAGNTPFLMDRLTASWVASAS